MVAQAIIISLLTATKPEITSLKLIEKISMKNAVIEVIRDNQVKMSLSAEKIKFLISKMEGEASKIECTINVPSAESPLKLKLNKLWGKNKNQTLLKFSLLKGEYLNYRLSCGEGEILFKGGNNIHLKSHCVVEKERTLHAKFTHLIYNKTDQEIKIQKGLKIKYEGR